MQKKNVCIRFGPHYNDECCPLTADCIITVRDVHEAIGKL